MTNSMEGPLGKPPGSRQALSSALAITRSVDPLAPSVQAALLAFHRYAAVVHRGEDARLGLFGELFHLSVRGRHDIRLIGLRSLTAAVAPHYLLPLPLTVASRNAYAPLL